MALFFGVEMGIFEEPELHWDLKRLFSLHLYWLGKPILIPTIITTQYWDRPTVSLPPLNLRSLYIIPQTTHRSFHCSLVAPCFSGRGTKSRSSRNSSGKNSRTLPSWRKHQDARHMALLGASSRKWCHKDESPWLWMAEMLRMDTVQMVQCGCMKWNPAYHEINYCPQPRILSRQLICSP